MTTKLREGSIFRVHGTVFLQHLEPGDYRVVVVHGYSSGLCYAIAKRRGRKILVRHRTESIDGWIQPANSTDCNRIEVLPGLAPVQH